MRDTMLYFEQFERATKTQKLGLLISEAENTVSKSTFSRFLDNSPTLFVALRKLCVHAQQHTSLARLWVSETDDEIVLCRANYDQLSLGLRQHEQYVIGFLVRLIEYAAGTDWRPRMIWTSAPGQYNLKETNTFADCGFMDGQPYTAITIPKALMIKAPGNFFETDSAATDQPDDVRNQEPASDDFAGSLRQLLVTVLKDRPLDIDTVADILGMHPRTLQRRLWQEGSSYQVVSDAACFRVATQMLLSPGATVTEVSRAIGFSTVSNFSRSFKRVAGLSPREYLKIYSRA